MKNLRPFLVEFAILLFCAAGILAGLFAGGFFGISIRPHLLSFAACGLLVFLIVWLWVPVVSRGIGALLDLLFRRSVTVEGKIMQVLPERASVFTEKNVGKIGDHVFARETRYRYLVKSKRTARASHISLLSPLYYEFDPERTYALRYGKFSNILLDIREI